MASSANIMAVATCLEFVDVKTHTHTMKTVINKFFKVHSCL